MGSAPGAGHCRWRSRCLAGLLAAAVTLTPGLALILHAKATGEPATGGKGPQAKATAEKKGVSPLRIPTFFEKNLGQTDASVDFVVRGPRETTYLKRGEAVTILEADDPPSPKPPNRTRHAVRLRLIGGASPAPAKGISLLKMKSSYFVGNDRGAWRTGIPAFGKVLYKSVYPGIDLVYHGKRGGLEYDFIVAPGANPGRISLSFSGVDGMRVDSQGDLVLQTPGGKIEHKKPLVYQSIHARQERVSGRYVIGRANTVRFNLGPYDRSRPLVIDPKIAYSTYLGGSGDDNAFGVARDESGGVYVAGSTSSLDFPGNPKDPRDPEREVDAAGDSMIVKLNTQAPGPDSLVWAAHVGGENTDGTRALAVAASGEVVVGGNTKSADFPWTGPTSAPWSEQYCVGRAETPNGPQLSSFVFSLNPDATQLLFATCIKGNLDTGGLYGESGVAVDRSGNVYVTGETSESDFATPDALQPAYGQGPRDAFVVQVAAGGSRIDYATYLGGDAEDTGNSIAVGPSGDVYVAGKTNSENFPTTRDEIGVRGDLDAFVARLQPKAGAFDLAFSTILSGSSDDFANGIVTDDSLNAYVTGKTFSSDFPTRNAAQPTFGDPGDLPSGDAFVTKLDTFRSGDDALKYSTFLGGSSGEVGSGIAVDLGGHAYVIGTTTSIDFPVRRPFQLPPADASPLGGNGFVTKVSSDGRSWIHSSYLGGGAPDYAQDVVTAPGGAVLVAGVTKSPDFPQGEGGYQTSFADAGDLVETDSFFVRIEPLLPAITRITPASGPTTGGTSVLIQGTGFPDPVLLADAALAGEPAVTVRFGEKPASRVEVLSPAQIRAVTPASQAGTVDVTVTTFEGTSPIVANDRFTYIAPAPTPPPPDEEPDEMVPDVPGSGWGSNTGNSAVATRFPLDPTSQTSGLATGLSPPPAPPAPGSAPALSPVPGSASSPASFAVPAGGQAPGAATWSGPPAAENALPIQAAPSLVESEGEPGPVPGYSMTSLSAGFSALAGAALCVACFGVSGAGRMPRRGVAVHPAAGYRSAASI